MRTGHLPSVAARRGAYSSHCVLEGLARDLFQILLVLALIAVAAAQYPYYAGYYGTGYYGTYASPYAYSGLGYGFYGR
jgi:hypothetical protein